MMRFIFLVIFFVGAYFIIDPNWIDRNFDEIIGYTGITAVQETGFALAIIGAFGFLVARSVKRKNEQLLAEETFSQSVKTKNKTNKIIKYENPKNVDLIVSKVVEKNGFLYAYDLEGNRVSGISAATKNRALENKIYLGRKKVASGYRWVNIDPKNYKKQNQKIAEEKAKATKVASEKKKREALKETEIKDKKRREQQEKERKSKELERLRIIDEKNNNGYFIEDEKSATAAGPFTQQNIQSMLDENKIDLKTKIKKGIDTKIFKSVVKYKEFTEGFEDFL
jgi:hypothetical protein